MPNVFAHQKHVEDKVRDGIKSIELEHQHEFSSPALMKHVQPDVHSIQAISSVMDARMWAGHDEVPDEHVALAHSLARQHKDAIISRIDDKIEKFKGLRPLADEAIAKQYPHGQINRAIHQWQGEKKFFKELE